MNRIRVTLGDVVVTATFNDSSTAQQLWDVLPIDSTAQRWGDEVYFKTPVATGEEDPQADRNHDLVEEGRPHADPHPLGDLGHHREDGAPKHGKGTPEKDEVVEQEARLAREEGIEVMAAFQLVPSVEQ